MFANKSASDLPGIYKLRGAGGGNFLLDDDGTTQLHFTAALTAAQLADAMLLALQRVYERSDKQIMPNRLAIPLKLRNKAARMRLGDNNNSGVSVLQYVADNSDFLTSPDDIVGVSSLSGFFPKRGSRKATDAIIAYEYNADHVRCKVMTPRRHSVRAYPFGQHSIWAGRMTPVQWLRPIACEIFESDPNYSAS